MGMTGEHWKDNHLKKILVAALVLWAWVAATPPALAGEQSRLALRQSLHEQTLNSRSGSAEPSARSSQSGADSGSITGVRSLATSSGEWTATYTATSNYCSYYSGYCGWFAYATQVPAGYPCDPYDTSNPTFVSSEVWEETGTRTESGAFYPAWTNGTLCLHLHQSDERRVTVAQTSYSTASFDQPPPSSPPPPQSYEPEPLSADEAMATIRTAIRKKTRRSPAGLDYGCVRLDDLAFVCDSSWRDRRFIYAGTFEIEADADTVYWKFSGLRASRKCLKRYRSAKTGVRRCARRVTW